MTTGVFLSLEGIDGSGKGTQLPLLADRLRATGREVVTTFTPGGTPFGQTLRRILVDQKAGSGLSSWTEFHLFLADMVETGATLITPALARGAIVLSDRFWHSTLVYQDYRRHGSFQTFPTLELPSRTPGLLTPDRVILLDLPVSIAAQRTAGRGEQNHYDTEALERRERVRNGFLSLALHATGYAKGKDVPRIRRVDASGSIAQVQAQVWDVVKDLL